MFADAKAAYRARNALALLIEQDLQLARWLAGLHGLEARRDVSELVSSMVETGHMLPLLEDRLLTIIEASQVGSESGFTTSSSAAWLLISECQLLMTGDDYCTEPSAQQHHLGLERVRY